MGVRRRVVLVAVATIAIAGAVVVGRSQHRAGDLRPDDGSTGLEGSPPPSTTPVDVASVESLASGSKPIPADERLVQRLEDDSVESAPIAEPMSDQPLFGTVVRIDANRVEHRKENGFIELEFLGAAEAGGRAVIGTATAEVTDGVFRCRSTSAEVRVRAVVLGGRPAVVRSASPAHFAVQRVLHVSAYFAAAMPGTPTVSISVVDDATRERLRDVEIVHANLRSRAARGASPLELTSDAFAAPPIEGETVPIPVEPFIARAPGYVPRTFDVRFEGANDLVVELSRGATLELRVVGKLPKPRGTAELEPVSEQFDPVRHWLRAEPVARVAVFRIPTAEEVEASVAELEELLVFDDHCQGRKPDREAIEARLDAWRVRQMDRRFQHSVAQSRLSGDGKPIVFDGLEPGEVLIAVDMDGILGHGIVLAETRVRLDAGETEEVTVVLDGSGLETRRSPVSGTLFVPASWELRSPRPELSIESVSVSGLNAGVGRSVRVEPVPDRPGTWRWNAGELPSGRWRADVLDLDEWQEEFDVPPSGASDLALSVPEPAIARIRLHTNSATELDADLEVTAESMTEGRRRHLPVLRDREIPNGGRVRTLPGPIRLGVLDDWEIVGAATFSLHAGTNDLVLDVRPRTGIALRLPSPRNWTPGLAERVTLRPVGHEGHAEKLVGVARQVWYVDRPGRWRVEVASPGGEDSSFEVELAAETMVERVIDLAMEQ